MLFEFFISHVLRRSLTLPLTFGFVHPAIDGDLIIRNTSLHPSVVAQVGAELRVGKMRVDPRWGGLYEEVIPVDEAQLNDIEVVVDMRRPTAVLSCLYNRSCISPTAARARLVAPTVPVEGDPSNAVPSKPPLRALIKKLKIGSGHIQLLNDTKRLVLEIAEIRASDIQLPLTGQALLVEADVFARSYNEGQHVRHPVRLRITWEPDRGVAQIAMVMQGLPISYFTDVLPELTSELHGLGGEGELGGSLSGEIVLEYDEMASAAGKASWRLK